MNIDMKVNENSHGRLYSGTTSNEILKAPYRSGRESPEMFVHHQGKNKQHHNKHYGSPSSTRKNGSPKSHGKKNGSQQQQNQRRAAAVMSILPPPLVSPESSPVTSTSFVDYSQYVAMDCEMVGVGELGSTSALARVTIVDWFHNVVYDQYVRPHQVVTDYRTHVSGIVPTDIDKNSKAINFYTCRTQVMKILRNKILIGHALVNDLNILKVYHPESMIRDTAQYAPFMKTRHGFDEQTLWPRKLKDLCIEKLNLHIQQVTHSSIEDSVSALELYKSVQYTWESKCILEQQEQQQQQQQHEMDYAYSQFFVQQQQQHEQKQYSPVAPQRYIKNTLKSKYPDNYQSSPQSVTSPKRSPKTILIQT